MFKKMNTNSIKNEKSYQLLNVNLKIVNDLYFLKHQEVYKNKNGF